MSPLVESLAVIDGAIPLLHWHQERYDRSRKALWGLDTEPIALPNLESIEPGLHKLRVIYDHTGILHTEISPYHIRKIKRVGICIADDLSYPYKYVHREALDDLRHHWISLDEILIVKNNCFTDAYYYNLVFEDAEGNFWTPKDPLLHGVRRALLLADGTIQKRKIATRDLHHYIAIHFINALTDLHECVMPIEEGRIY